MSDNKYTPPEVVIAKGDILFIDTCIFDSFKYSFDTPHFKSLYDLRQELGFVVVISSVVESEVLSHIERDYARTLSGARKIDDDIGSDYAVEFKSVIEQVSVMIAQTKSKVLTSWELFKKRLGVVVLPYDMVSTTEIFQRYFDVSPPFDAKTKSEFPDAFSAIALEKYKTSIGAGQCVIVSTDGIFAKYGDIYPGCIVFKRLQEFIASAARNKKHAQPTIVVPASVPPPPVPDPTISLLPVVEAADEPAAFPEEISNAEVFKDEEDLQADDAELMAQIYKNLTKLISDNRSEIENAVSVYVEGLSFDVHGSLYVDDEYMEVEHVFLQSFRIDDVDADSQTARLEVTIDLTACVSYTCSVWDSVDREYVSMGSSSTPLDGSYTGFVEISYSNTDIDVDGVEFEALSDISIEAELDYD